MRAMIDGRAGGLPLGSLLIKQHHNQSAEAGMLHDAPMLQSSLPLPWT